jgi:HAD superfamily hydrolase (TIGR01662 family)
VHVASSIEDSMFNAVSRMIGRHGKLFMKTDDYQKSKDPNMFPPAALYKANKTIEKPTVAEGFDEVKIVPFKRTPNGYTNKAVIFDYDGTLRKTKSGGIYPTSPDDIVALPGRTEKLNELKKQGYVILGVSNQSGVAKGLLSYEMAEKCFDKTNQLLNFDIDYRFCSHSVPPITCYCRKPGVGFGVEFIEKYKLDPSQCIMVGDMKTDETFAKRCGFKYVHADTFFK